MTGAGSCRSLKWKGRFAKGLEEALHVVVKKFKNERYRERKRWVEAGGEGTRCQGERKGVREGAALPREGGHSRNAVNSVFLDAWFSLRKNPTRSHLFYIIEQLLPRGHWSVALPTLSGTGAPRACPHCAPVTASEGNRGWK